MYEIMESGPVQGTAQHLEALLLETANIFAHIWFVLSLYETHKTNPQLTSSLSISHPKCI
jgi:hypothetical protein